MGFAGVLEKGFVVVALLLFAGAILPLARQGESVAEVQGDLPSQFIFLGIYGITIFLVLPWWKRFAYLATRDKALIVLVGIALLSVLWSAAPEVTLRRGVALVGTTLFGTYLATRYAPEQQLRLLAWALGTAAALSLVVSLALPQYGVHSDGFAEGWRGVFVHKNTLGRLMVLSTMLFLLLALSVHKYRWAMWGGLGLSASLLLLSNSKTALVVLSILLILLPFCGTLRWRYTLMMPSLIVAVVLGGGVAVWLFGTTETVLDALGKDVTLTGRSGIWSAVLEKIWDYPWLGHGYGAFWLGWEGQSSYVWVATSFQPSHAHNGFLDLWLDLGLLGILAFSAVFVLAFVQSMTFVRLTPTALGFWPILYMAFMLLYNTTESTILVQNNLSWVLFVAAVLSTHPMMRGRERIARDLALGRSGRR